MTALYLTDPDLARDTAEAALACPSCGHPEPARLGPDGTGRDGCSECLAYDRCYVCKRWTGLEWGAYVWGAMGGGGGRVAVCERCHERGDGS